MTGLSPRSALLATYGIPDGGLTLEAVHQRRSETGWNELPQKPRSILRMFFRQFQNVLIVILLVAAAVSFIVPLIHSDADSAEWIDAVVILAIVLLNAFLGTAQEWKAENAIAALRALSAPQATVRRSGVLRVIPARELVPGDLLIVEAGDRLSADARIIASSSLEVDESSLTGESLPVEKTVITAVSLDATEQSGMVYSGTLVTRGSAEAIIVATGMQTEIGKITALVLEYSEPPTPLQQTLRSLGHRVGIAVLFLCGVISLGALYRGFSAMDVFFTVISLAVAAVPEGLPAVATICLALGVQSMARRHALVRKMDAVETLGAVTVICADKTGTITENRMTVHSIVPLGTFHDRDVLVISASCNRAELPDIGDPTEVGLLVAAHERGIDRLAIAEEDVPFTSEAKYMATFHETSTGRRRFLKGAPEVIARFVSPSEALVLQGKAEELSAQGLRVLAVAEGYDQSISAVGLVSLADPPRSGASDAISLARNAGIRTVMITGDHPSTALTVARAVGIVSERVLSGAELSLMNDKALFEAVRTVSVFARVRPEHKARILGALQAHGEIVCMSGDGVNDAPALKRANVGIGMGLRGTAVAREASAMVLTDDDFSSIVAAIEEGRRIYDNIRKVVLFLLRSNVGEVTLIASALLLGVPLPLLPLHILWINLVTDSFPALALAMERGDPRSMLRPPRSVRQGLLHDESSSLLVSAALNAALSLSAFAYALLLSSGNITLARTAALTATIVFQMFLAFSVRPRCAEFFRSPFSNRWLIAAIIIALFLHVVLLYSPLAQVFSVVPLPPTLWAVIVFGALVASMAFELFKYVRLKITR